MSHSNAAPSSPPGFSRGARSVEEEIVEVPGPAGPPGHDPDKRVAALMPGGKYEVPQDLHGNS